MKPRQWYLLPSGGLWEKGQEGPQGDEQPCSHFRPLLRPCAQGETLKTQWAGCCLVQARALAHTVQGERLQPAAPKASQARC